MYYYRGDNVRLNDGSVVEVVDSWGVARYWCKLKNTDGSISFRLSSDISELVSRPSSKNSGRKKSAKEY